jgi:hypothetical protein
MNMVAFKGEMILIRPNTADKGKDKEVIIGNAREADGNNKISCRKVVAEKTPDGRETLKVTIITFDTGGQAQTRGHAREPILRIADGLVPRRGRSLTSLDGLEHSSGRYDNIQEPQRPRTFKPRRPEIGMWKTNTFKAAGRLVKSGLTFDQLLSKYVKKKAGPSDRPPKRPCLPTQERQQIRPIGPPHQSERTGGHNVQLRPNAPAWTPPPPHTPMSCHYIDIPPLPYILNQMWGVPPYPFGIPQYPAWGAPQSSVFDRLTPLVQDRLRALQSGPRAQAQQDCRATRPHRLTNPAEGHIATTSNSTIKGDAIKIGTRDVVVQQNNEGPMMFGESANKQKRRYDCQQNSRSKILHAPMVPIGIDTITKAKITAPQSKGESRKGGKKYSMTHIRSTHHRKRDRDQRPLRKSKRPQRQKIKQQLCSSLQV